MVRIEQLFFLPAQPVCQNGPAVERYHGQGLKPVELSLICGESGHAEHQVLQTDAVAAGQIEAGFIGCHHTGLKRNTAAGHSDPMGTFMDIEQVTYAVTGPMIEVQSHLPEGQPCQGIQFYPAAAFVKDRAGQIQIAPQDRCIVFFHLVCHSAQYSRPGNIRGPLQVLTARIHQQKAVMDKGNIGILIGVIMHNGAMAARRDDRREALVQESILLPAQLQQTRCHIQFCDPALFIIPGVLDLIQPVQKLRDRCPVPDMGSADVGRLHGILDCLL